MSDDRDSRGMRRVNVHRDGTRDVEEIKSDHPVIARLADLIQDQLVVEILHHELGVLIRLTKTG